jgi:hypothetical protein
MMIVIDRRNYILSFNYNNLFLKGKENDSYQVEDDFFFVGCVIVRRYICRRLC